jgi:hypothetical protein
VTAAGSRSLDLEAGQLVAADEADPLARVADGLMAVRAMTFGVRERDALSVSGVRGHGREGRALFGTRPRAAIRVRFRTTLLGFTLGEGV